MADQAGGRLGRVETRFPQPGGTKQVDPKDPSTFSTGGGKAPAK